MARPYLCLSPARLMPDLRPEELEGNRAALLEAAGSVVRVPTAPHSAADRAPPLAQDPAGDGVDCRPGPPLLSPQSADAALGWLPTQEVFVRPRAAPHKGLDPRKTNSRIEVALRRTPSSSQLPLPSTPAPAPALLPLSGGNCGDPLPSSRTNQDYRAGGGEEAVARSPRLGGETRGKSPGPVSPNFLLICNFFFQNFFIADFRMCRPRRLTQVSAEAYVLLLVWLGEAAPQKHKQKAPPAQLRSPMRRKDF